MDMEAFGNNVFLGKARFMKFLWPRFLIAIVTIVIIGCRENPADVEVADQVVVDSTYYREAYRPQYHFTPQEKWMNDPNGLVYHNGTYHLFYQHYPQDIVWGPMHWGHAVSKDMVFWEHKPIALYPDEHGLIFSGSAVMDYDNTSGFADGGRIPMVAVYTYHDMEKEQAGRNDFQTQGIAYSNDEGETWTKYINNPVIKNDSIRDFRDPKVFWHEPINKWVMVLVAGDHAKIYASPNLIDWTHLSDFGKDQGAHGGVWECPDLFPLEVDDTGEKKWVMLISINPGAPNGGSGTQYFIGEFTGMEFVSEQKETLWLDWGTDNYAGVTYNHTPDDSRIFIGWMSNWNYARDTPTEVWRSAMTVPRNLELKKTENGEFFLANYPLEQLNTILGESQNHEVSLEPGGKIEYQVPYLNQSEVRFNANRQNFKLVFSNGEDELRLALDSENSIFTLDRTESGKTDFEKSFGEQIQKMPIADLPEEFEVRILSDWSSVEVFLNQGQYVMTAQVFPNNPFEILEIENIGPQELTIPKLEVSKVERIW